jgi:DNA-binding NarL/FixJ family response regulator
MPHGEPLLGRDGEQAAIEELLTEARASRGGVIAVRGDPGIGKTSVLTRARAQAEGFRVLHASGVQSEARIPFGALLSLLRPALGVLEDLPERQRLALAGALAVGPPAPGDPLTIGAATLGVLAAAGGGGPLLVVVDDAHWLDEASAGALLFAARRLGHDPVAMVLATREGEGTPLDLAGIPVLELRGLDRDAALALLVRENPGLDGAGVERALDVAAGNPLALLELAELPGGWAADAAAGLPPAVGPAVEAAFSRRIEALPAATQRVLLLAAAGEAEPLERLAAAARRLGLGLDALAPAEAAGLVELGPDRIHFRHPLVRSAGYQRADPADRRVAHGALAEVLDDGRSGLRRAWHLAAAAVGPHEAVAAALERAAGEARVRLGVAAAATALERAARLTPAGNERGRRLVAAAGDRILAGATAAGVALLDEAAGDVADPRLQVKAGALRGRAELLRGSLAQSHELLAGVAERVCAEDPQQAALLLLEAALPCFMAGRLAAAVSTTARAHELTGELGGPVAALAALELGSALAISGSDHERAERLVVDNALEIDGTDLLLSPSSIVGILQSLTWYERYADGLDVADRARSVAEATGAFGVIPMVLAARCDIEYRTGAWTAARAHAAESVRLAEGAGQEMQTAFPLNALARLEAARGQEQSAVECSARALAIAGESGMRSMEVYAGAALGLLDLGAGRPERAAERLLRVRDACEEFGMRDPSVVQWRPDLVEALLRCGRVEEAHAEAAVYAAQAQLTRRANVLATAARLRGLLAADDDEAQRCFAEAVDSHARGADPFERARTELAAGERLRRARRSAQAREPLRSALATFVALGAEPWARRARTELRASGGAPVAVATGHAERLTGQELEVALLVSVGASNREVAAALLLSVRTVEVHLSRVYRKLGLRSRTELAALMARDAAALTA